MKLNRNPFLCGVLSAVLLFVPFINGCSDSDVTKAVSATVAGLDKAQALMPDARVIIADIKLADPELGAKLELLESQAEQIIATLDAAGKDFLTKPSDGAYQTLLNGVSSLVSQANANTLKQLHVSNPNTQLKIQAWLHAFVTAMAVVDVILKANAKPSQLKAIPVQAASLEQLRPYVDRGQAVALLNEMGYDGQAAVEHYGL